MTKQSLTFDQLPEYVYELGRKVDQLTALLASKPAPIEEVGGLALAVQVTRLSTARIYTLVSKRQIPHKKRGNRLYFNRAELLAWVEQGNRQEKGGERIL